MMKIGITGQNGFIGSHMYNFLSLKEGIELQSFERNFFNNPLLLEKFVSKCDIIIHFAALNRHEDPQVIYNTNVSLVEKLISACEATKSIPWIIMSSSIQEDEDNLYGASKKKGRELLEKWAKKNNAKTSGLVIPNVFGPFGKPFYNSVFATFCHKIIEGKEPTIVKDSELRLIYINELSNEIFKVIKHNITGRILIPHYHQLKVSELLEKLKSYYHLYVENDEFPDLTTNTDLAMFNSFRCYIPVDFYPRKLKLHSDDRGAFVEIVRTNTTGQFSYSTTVSGVTRGNHFHTRKAERFAVIKGIASIKLRKLGSSKIIEYIINGKEPAFVDIPIWYTHSIKNIGEEELITLFWINEPYNPNDSDTYFLDVIKRKDE